MSSLHLFSGDIRSHQAATEPQVQCYGRINKSDGFPMIGSNQNV